jgi:hypothetical protein
MFNSYTTLLVMERTQSSLRVAEVPSIKRLAFELAHLSSPSPQHLPLIPKQPKEFYRKLKSVSSLASSLLSSPENPQVKEMQSPTKFTPGGSSKSFLALLHVVSKSVLDERFCSSFSRASPRVQQDSYTPVRADFPEIPKITMSDSVAPTEDMKKQVSEAFAQALSSILPSKQPQQLQVSGFTKFKF